MGRFENSTMQYGNYKVQQSSACLGVIKVQSTSHIVLTGSQGLRGLAGAKGEQGAPGDAGDEGAPATITLIDECETSTVCTGAEQVCTDTEMSFSCSCQTGYTDNNGICEGQCLSQTGDQNTRI